MSAVEIAADSEEERQFLPKPSTLAGQLLLADRGYPSTTYFDEVGEHGGSFVLPNFATFSAMITCESRRARTGKLEIDGPAHAT